MKANTEIDPPKGSIGPRAESVICIYKTTNARTEANK